MKEVSGINRAGIALALLMAAGTMHADEFVVGGPLDVFIDLASSEQRYDYVWTAKVTYEPDGAVREIYNLVNYDQSYFYGSIVSIEYAIYDSTDALVVTGLETGHVGNVVSAANDINPDDTIYDLAFWYADDPLSSTRSRASIGFSDSSGTMIDTVELYPDVPQLGEFDFGGSEFYSYTPDTGQGFKAWGRIKTQSVTDPAEDCSTNARNHGQYVSCMAKFLNALRKAGEITGKEKGQWLSLIARSNELRTQVSPPR